jgi:hypothetical protein
MPAVRSSCPSGQERRRLKAISASQAMTNGAAEEAGTPTLQLQPPRLRPPPPPPSSSPLLLSSSSGEPSSSSAASSSSPSSQSSSSSIRPSQSSSMPLSHHSVAPG